MDISYVYFRDIDLSDVFFDSLKRDYSEFEIWFQKKKDEKAYVLFAENGSIDGFLYLKVEEGPVLDVTPSLGPGRRLKVGTFKINAHATKLGERFVKKVFDHAITLEIDEIYVTVFPTHKSLIDLLMRYGFKEIAKKTTTNGTELVLLKKIKLYEADATKQYPLIKLNNGKNYLLSLYPKWHTRLLPDSILKTEKQDIIQDVSHTNSIHKVYLAAMEGMERLKPGDKIVIYRTSDGQGPAHYRSVATSICVIEEYRRIFTFSSLNEFKKYCSPYSVFTDAELENFWETKRFPHVIRFTYNLALKRRVTRQELLDDIGLDSKEYFGFLELTQKQLYDILKAGLVDESIAVDKT